MKEKKRFLRILMIIILGIIFIGGVSYIVDPYQQYRVPKFYKMVNLNSSARFLNPGLIKNRDYESIIVGSSMMENMAPKFIEEKLKLYPVKQTFSGATSKEINILLNYIYSLKKVKNIIYGLDILVYFDDKDYTKIQMPLYLYDNNRYNDYNYLLSFDTYRYIAIILLKNLKKDTIEIDDLYSWDKNIKYSKEDVLKNYKKNQKEILNFNINEELLKRMMNNFEKNTLDVIRDDIQYIIIFPPYSILTYTNINEIGTFLKFKKKVIDKLLELKNIQIYDFQYVDEITFDLDNYKDFSHYSPKISNLLIEYISEKRYKVNSKKENMENIEKLRQQIKNYKLSI